MAIRLDAHGPEFLRKMPPQLPVRCATTADITIATALNNGDTIDGITLATGDRVLVKNQSTGSQNGIYIVGATPERSFDMLEGVAAYGALVYVAVGTANGGKLFKNTNTTVPTIGSTALTFAEFTGSGAPTDADYLVGTAHAGLSAEIVVGTSPGGELGGTWASPTVDTTHSGSAHADFIAKSLLTTQDDIIVRDGTGPARLAKGTDGQVLTVDPTTHHLVWATPSAGSGDVATDTIWDAKGDLAVASGADAASRLAVGSNGQVLTADSAQTLGVKWATPSGGSSSIAYGSLKPGTPTMDFTGSDLASATAVSSGGSFATGDCFEQAVDGSHIQLGYRTSMGYLYWSAANGDQELIVGGLKGQGTVLSLSGMFGIALLDSSGNGVGVVSYTDGNAYLAEILGGQYNTNYGSISGLGHDGSTDFNYAMRLTRVGNTWDGYISLTGNAWDYHMSATGSKTITVARKCIGMFYNTGSTYKGRLLADWLHTV